MGVFQYDLFSYDSYAPLPPLDLTGPIDESFPVMLERASGNSLVQSILCNAIIRYLNYEHSNRRADFVHALREHSRIVEGLPYTDRTCGWGGPLCQDSEKGFLKVVRPPFLSFISLVA